jgi:hypothetical protein
MKIFRISNFLIVIFTAALGGMLFWVSQSVQRAEGELFRLTNSVYREQESIQVLSAEWDYLNRPQRLEALATEYLSMDIPQGKSVLPDYKSIPEPMIPVLPPSKPAVRMQHVSVKAAPVKSDMKAHENSVVERKSFDSLLEQLSEEGR